MNELKAVLAENPSWAICFDESDRMVVESLVRLAQENFPVEPKTQLPSEALILALLLLVRSVRLEHVALDLAEPAVARTLEFAGVLDGSHGDDPTFVHGHICLPSGRASAVDDRPTSNHQVNHLRRLPFDPWNHSESTNL